MRPEEFPELTQAARAARDAALDAIQSTTATISLSDLRRAFAAFLREAMKQATDNSCILYVNRLRAIADNLHNPPPLPPTLAQAREADLDTPEGREVVRAFLATLGAERDAAQEAVQRLVRWSLEAYDSEVIRGVYLWATRDGMVGPLPPLPEWLARGGERGLGEP
jgi:hypothetical protein